MRFEEKMRNKSSEFRHLLPLAAVMCGFVAGVAAEKFGQFFGIPHIPIGLMVCVGLAALLAYLIRLQSLLLEEMKALEELRETRMNRRESHENF